MRLLFLSLFLVFSSAHAARIECTAKVTIHQFQVSVDTDTQLMTVKTSTGAIFQGMANHYVPSSGKFENYYMPVSYTSSLMLEIEKVGEQQTALCLKANECYLCK